MRLQANSKRREKQNEERLSWIHPILQYFQFLDVVVEVDGFAHGQEELTLKCLAAHCRLLHFESNENFASPGLVNRSPQQLATYKFQSDLHGFTLSSPGRPQHQAPLVLSRILCDIQRQFLLVMKAPIAPLRVWVKGHSKSNFVRTLLPLNFDTRNLEDLGCPALRHISNKWVTTLSKARSLGEWLATRDLAD